MDIAILTLLGMASGFISGLFGIGGGIILTPLLAIFGVPLSGAAAISSLQIVFSAAVNLVARRKENAVNYKLGVILAAGSIIGSLSGIAIISIIKKYNGVDLFISLVFIVVLGLLAAVNLKSAFIDSKQNKQSLSPQDYHANNLHKTQNLLSLAFLTKSFVAGIFAGFLMPIMGVGGGFVIVPFLLYIGKVDKNIAVCTSIFQMLIASCFTSFINVCFIGNIDFKIAFFVITGAIASVNLGGLLSKKTSPELFKKLLGFLMLSVALYFVFKICIN